MVSIFTLGFHSLKLLFKSKWLLLIIFLLPLLISTFVTFGLQMAYKPVSSYLIKSNSENDSIEFIAKKAKDAGEMFKNESDLYPVVEKQMAMKTELPEVVKNTSRHFFKLLLPVYYPKFGKMIDTAMTNLNVILVVLFTISVLPAILGVFIMNLDKKDQTITSIIAYGVSSFEYLFSKLFAGLLLSVLITVASLIGYIVGTYVNAAVTVQKFSIHVANINQIVILGIIGAFCAFAISIMFSFIITENKAQIIVGGFFTPIIVIAIFVFAIQKPIIQNSINDIQTQFSNINIERTPVDKKEVSFLAERQIYDRSQMVAVKIGAEIIPDAILEITKNTPKFSIDQTRITITTFLGITAIVIFLSFFLSILRFRSL